LIKWGHSERWITESPDELLKGLSNTVTKMKGLKQSIESGENAMFVNLSEIPTHGDVAAVAAAAAEVSGIWWYELLFNLAAYSGMRIGEIFDLDVTQINTEAKTIRITSQCLEVGGKKSRALPKFGKQRTTIYPRITPSGYPLAEEVKRRVAEIQEVEDAPTLLDGTSRRLLFHNPRGSWISQSWFASRIRRPAQEKAGWPKSGDQYRWTFHSLRHVFCSYYLGDLKQSPQDVAIVAGHSDAFTTISMYVGASREAIDKLSSAN
jgi:integrase